MTILLIHYFLTLQYQILIETKAMREVKLIYKARETYFPTTNPAYFYGSPDNKVYVVYTTPYLTPSGKTNTEFVIARHQEFSYNYLEERLIENITKKTPFVNSLVDKRNPLFTNMKSSKSCKNHEDAEELLNKWISEEMAKAAKIAATKPPAIK